MNMTSSVNSAIVSSSVNSAIVSLRQVPCVVSLVWDANNNDSRLLWHGEPSTWVPFDLNGRSVKLIVRFI